MADDQSPAGAADAADDGQRVYETTAPHPHLSLSSRAHSPLRSLRLRNDTALQQRNAAAGPREHSIPLPAILDRGGALSR